MGIAERIRHERGLLPVVAAAMAALMLAAPMQAWAAPVGRAQSRAPAADEGLVVEDSGFGQKEKQVGFAFLVRNPNEDQAVGRTEYQIAFYDESDTVVKTDTGYIELILPAQTLGVAGTEYLDDGVEVKRIEVQLNDGEPEKVDKAPKFEISQINYWPDDYSPRATAIIDNPFKANLDDMYVYAVAYDGNNKIIGGGYTFLALLPAESAAGVKVSLVTSDEPDHIEIYPTFSYFSTATTKKDNTDAKPIAILSQGFSKKGTHIGYGFVVSNPNAKLAIENSRYQLTAYDKKGRVLETDDGYIGTLLPNEKLGIGDSLYLPGDTAIDKLVLQIKTGKGAETTVASPLSTTKVTYKDDRYSPKVTGILKSTHKKKLENVPVYAVAYDAKDVIIGGGFTYVNFVSANGQAPVEIYMTVDTKPARVELYASVPDLDKLK